MDIAHVVLLIGVTIAIAVIALYLIAIGLILKRVYDQLNVILGAVGDVIGATAPAGAVIDEINGDLARAQTQLATAVQRLEERRREEEPVASGPEPYA
ncbi:MAG: hypothetical protein WKF94_01315 [Solirubrobacteraceae bacterium]